MPDTSYYPHVPVIDGIKVYVAYEEAWWQTKLGLFEGELDDNSTNPPLKIRYHDGPTIKSAGAATSRGAILAMYEYNALDPGIDFYLNYRPDGATDTDAVNIFNATDPLPLDVHRRLLEVQLSIALACLTDHARHSITHFCASHLNL